MRTHQLIISGLLATSVGLLSSCHLFGGQPITAKPNTPPPQCAALFENHTLPVDTVAGSFKNAPFQFDEIVFQEGVLTFTQKNPERHVRVFIGVKDGEVPIDQTFQLIPPGVTLKEPPISGVVSKIELEWIDTNAAGQRVTKKQTFTKGPALWLMLSNPNAPKDKEKVGVKKPLGDQVAGQIYLCLNDAGFSHLSGAFTADIKGFRLLPNGLPDLTKDSVKNFQYLAEEYLKEENAQVPVEILEVGPGRIDEPASPDDTPSGYIELTYRRDKYDQDGPHFVKFQFVKESEELEHGGKTPPRWRLHEALDGHKLGEAHPPRLPEAGSHAQIVYLAAQQVENEVNTQFPGAQIKNFTHQITTFEKVEDIAKIHVKYRLEGEQFANVPQKTPVTTTEEGVPDPAAATTEYDFDANTVPGKDFERNFALKLRTDDKGWEITQELTGGQDINPGTGVVEGAAAEVNKAAPTAKGATAPAKKP